MKLVIGGPVDTINKNKNKNNNIRRTRKKKKKTHATGAYPGNT
jgi:hypothetical protein